MLRALFVMTCGTLAVIALDRFTVPPPSASGAFIGAAIGYTFGGGALIGMGAIWVFQKLTQRRKGK